MKAHFLSTAAAVACLLLAGGASAQGWGPGADDKSFAEMLRTGFRNAGTVTVDRLVQDETQAFCSDPAIANSAAGAKRAEEIEAVNLASVKWPADGKFLGDWRAGERVAQSGRGLTWTDGANQANGGNCYNCHQISLAEISHGTLGPSLHNYGKLKGSDEQALRDAWAKIYNSKASNACSNMPRAGHMGILKEKDIQDLMALLFAPDSPVNR
jgi:sulfur-oxidizing protein SoxX